VKVIKTEEKKSDVNIAVHILNDAYKNEYECAVLVSNDSDISEALRIVRSELRKVVIILNPQERPSQELKKYASLIKPIRQGALAACQFPDRIEDENGTIIKPHKW
jgi:uncharacterized LabA/DUF88 family protein